MKRFNKRVEALLEDVTNATAFGPSQAHAPQTGKSSDFYAPGDARNMFGTKIAKKKKKTKFKAPGFKESKIIRRTFPGM